MIQSKNSGRGTVICGVIALVPWGVSLHNLFPSRGPSSCTDNPVETTHCHMPSSGAQSPRVPLRPSLETFHPP